MGSSQCISDSSRANYLISPANYLISPYLDMKLVCVWMLVTMLLPSTQGLPWYQGNGLGDCAPGKCPPTNEVSPITCSSDLTMYFNNGYPTVCGEGEQCDPEAADAGEGNPCKGGDGYTQY